MEPKQVVRNFNGSDAYMTQEARVAHALVEADLDRFTQLDTTINAESQAAFLEAIIAAETVVADTAIIDQQTQTTENLNTTLDLARAKYNEVKYFAGKIFPTSAGGQGEFGLNDYRQARQSANRMVQFLDEMHKACVKYHTQLVAAGYAPANIDAIQALRDELLTKNTHQKFFKKQRPKLTEDRVNILNSCFSKLVSINAAAQVVYMNDYAKQQQFVYNPSADVIGNEYTGNVAPGATEVITTIGYSENNVFTFRNTGAVPLIFCLSTTNNVEGIEVALGGGAIITRSASELNDNGTFLLVKNVGNVAGGYEVEVDN